MLANTECITMNSFQKSPKEDGYYAKMLFSHLISIYRRVLILTPSRHDHMVSNLPQDFLYRNRRHGEY